LKNIIFLVLFLSFTSLQAIVITPDLEYQKVSGVGYGWQTVSFDNSYSDAIVVCSNVLPSKSSSEAVVRIRNITSGSFQVKIQKPNDSDPGYNTDVFCVTSDEGSYTVPFKYEAHKVLSDGTNGYSAINNWSASRAENVSGDITQNYTRPAVLGQVMSYNDNRFSTFWSFDCDSYRNRPFQSGMSDGICVGKHVGQIRESRNSETLGYIVAEAGIYELEDFSIAMNYGRDSIRGMGTTPPYSYALDKSYTHGVVTQEAMDGAQGGWAELYGSNPIGSSLDLGIDEETVAGDRTRAHTTEEVAYWVMKEDEVTPAEMVINEVLYRQNSGTADEFVEFYVTQSGDLKNYLFSDQDGTSSQYRFLKHTVNTGDYVVLHIGNGTDSVVGGVHHFYMGRSSTILNDGGDDLVLYKPANDDVTIVNGVGQNVIPVDYIAYGSGSGIDSVPVSSRGVTVNWNTAYNSELRGAERGQSISLTPNAVDSDSSACWELATSGNASDNGCANYLPTRTTTSQKNSIGESNNGTLAEMSIKKNSIVLSDPVNNENKPKRIPGAIVRYCFTVDNNGTGDSSDSTIHDSFTGNGKDNLIYIKSGSLVQNISTPCDCQGITATNGTVSGTDVSIDIGTVKGTRDSAHSRGCAYIEAEIK